MDFSKAIAELYEDKEKLERVIASLEGLAATMAGQDQFIRNRAGSRFGRMWSSRQLFGP